MLHVEILVDGRLDRQWSEWFDGLNIAYKQPNQTTLTGAVKDQAALYGLLSKLWDIGIPLLSVNSHRITNNATG